MQKFRRLSEGVLATLNAEQRAEYDAAEKYDAPQTKRPRSLADALAALEKRVAALEAK